MLTIKLELHALQTQTILSHQRLQSNIFNKDNIKYYGLNMSFYFGEKCESIVITCTYPNDEYENRNNYKGPGLKKMWAF